MDEQTKNTQLNRWRPEIVMLELTDRRIDTGGYI